MGGPENVNNNNNYHRPVIISVTCTPVSGLEIEQCSNRRRFLVPDESGHSFAWHTLQKSAPEKWSRFSASISGACVMGIISRVLVCYLLISFGHVVNDAISGNRTGKQNSKHGSKQRRILLIILRSKAKLLICRRQEKCRKVNDQKVDPFFISVLMDKRIIGETNSRV